MRHNWQPPNMNSLNFLNTPNHLHSKIIQIIYSNIDRMIYKL